jgi:hypothetical protein
MPRRTWGPAWVGWAVEADYIGWSPLGWNSRPVIDFFIGGRVGPVDAWAGSWSVVPRRVFGGRGPIGRYYTDLRHLPAPVLGGFVVQSHSPRGPAGWDRRLPAARGYGRPAPSARDPRAYDRAPGYRVPSGPDAVPRPGRRQSDAVAVPGPIRRDDADQRDIAAGGRGPRMGRPPSAAGERRRDDAPAAGEARPSDPRPRDQARVREVAPRGGDDATRYGRPTASPGRAWGRTEPEATRPRAEGADRGRSADRSRQSEGGARARGGDGSRGSGGAGASADGGGGGNRRRPR